MLKKMIVKVESWEEMLRWGEELVQMIDRGEKLPESCIRSFEDPEDILALFTSSRRELLAEVLRCPGSVDELSTRLQRMPVEVEQDVRALVETDILTMEQDVVRPIAEAVIFEPIPQFAPEV